MCKAYVVYYGLKTAYEARIRELVVEYDAVSVVRALKVPWSFHLLVLLLLDALSIVPSFNLFPSNMFMEMETKLLMNLLSLRQIKSEDNLDREVA